MCCVGESVTIESLHKFFGKFGVEVLIGCCGQAACDGLLTAYPVMLKTFHLGIVFAVVLALFAFILARPLHFDIVLPQSSEFEPFLADEGTVRSERSANISHIIGISRKIQLIVNKIMFLQISPDGTVNGTDNDNDYTILQRASINHHQIKIQGVVTCNFLCMDRCGLLYGSKEFTDDCVFNEMMESHHYNTYSSAKYSNDKRTLYLALNKKGIPRKVQTKAKASLGKMQTYTNVLTKPVSVERVEFLALKIAKARLLLGKFLLGSEEDNLADHHLFRHHRYQFCPNVPITKLDDKNKFRCRKREKRKKKRKCREDEDDDDDCLPGKKKMLTEKCEEEEDEEECQKRLHSVRQKRKSRNGDSDASAKSADKKRKRRLKSEKKKFSEKTFKTKCDSEGNCFKKKVGGKNHRKEKTKTSISSGEDAVTAALLWKDSVDDRSPSTLTDSTTEKPTYDYEEEEPTEKVTAEEDEDEDASMETAAEGDWTTPPLSNRD